MYLTVVAITSLLMMAFNVNSNMNASASIFSDIQHVDDVGQSLECVIVVVGCDATGSVGSSGDVIVGSGDNNTNREPSLCEECLTEVLTPEQQAELLLELEAANLAEACVAIADMDAFTLIEIFANIELSPEEIEVLLECLGVEIPIP